MKLFGREIRKIKNPDRSLPIPSVSAGLSGALLWSENMTAAQLLSNTSVNSCVTLIADTIAMLPLNVYKKTENGRQRDDRPSLAYALRKHPNYYLSSFDFKQKIMMHLLLKGNAFIFIDRWPDYSVKALTPLYPDRVEIKFDEVGDIYYEYNYNGKTYKYTNDNILHIPAYLLDGPRGLSPIEYTHHAARLGLDLDRYTSDQFDGGIQSKIVVKVPVSEKNWTKEDSKKLNERLAEELTGKDARKRAMVLTQGVEQSALQMSSNADAQLDITRVFSEKEIAKMFRVPLSMLGKDDAKFTNNEQLNTFFLQHTLSPWMVRIQERLNWLLTYPFSDDHYVEFDSDAMLRADYKTRLDGLIRGVQNGVYTPNQVYDMENLPRTSEKWGDQHFMPVNISTVDKIAEQPLDSAKKSATTQKEGTQKEGEK